MTSGSRKSFQAHRQVRMPTVAFIGASSGKITFQKMPHVDAPSIVGGLLQLTRDRVDVGGEDEDVEREPVDDVQQDQADPVVEVQERGLLRHRQHDDGERHEQCGDEVEVHRLEEAALHVAGDRVGHHRVGQQREHDGSDGDDRRVERRLREVGEPPGVGEVGPPHLVRKPEAGAAQLVGRLEGGDHREVERERDGQGQDDQQGGQPPVDLAALLRATAALVSVGMSAPGTVPASLACADIRRSSPVAGGIGAG